ncbi:MAG: hypothetical protein RR396_01705, partial [Clostridiales bacterium]
EEALEFLCINTNNYALNNIGDIYTKGDYYPIVHYYELLQKAQKSGQGLDNKNIVSFRLDLAISALRQYLDSFNYCIPNLFQDRSHALVKIIFILAAHEDNCQSLTLFRELSLAYDDWLVFVQKKAPFNQYFKVAEDKQDG